MAVKNKQCKLAGFFVALFVFLMPLTIGYGYGSIKSPDEDMKPILDNSGNFKLSSDRLYLYPSGVQGPEEATVMPKAEPASWKDFAKEGTNRLAVLLTDTNSDWLSLTEGLKGMGIPFTITTDYKEAMKHNVVLIYPEVGGKTMTPWATQELMDFTEKGGTVIGVNVVTEAMNDFFGFDSYVETDKNQTIQFNPSAAPVVNCFQDPRERTIALGDARYKEANYGTYGYVHPRHTPLAVFDSGQAAVTMEHHGKGAAYAIGIDIGGFASEGYNDRGELIGRAYINEFEPASDVLMKLVKNIYTAGEKNAVTVWSVPNNKQVTVMFTHDLDWGLSSSNAVDYAKFEHSVGISGTYFVLAKYITDYNDAAFFSSEYIPSLKELRTLGGELASHGVSHSKVYEFAPLGTGTEKYPEYQPYVAGPWTLVNGTVLGELRVSKYLIESLVAGPKNVVSFRPGELSDPKSLAEALEATGYKYSSTMPANAALTTLPFRRSFGKDGTSNTPIFEFPLALEDELPPAPMIERVQAGIDVAKKTGRYGGICVVLIHPNETGQKLEYEKQLYAGIKDQAWFSNIGAFGDWWSARDQVEVKVNNVKGNNIVEVTAPIALEGLTLKVPAGWKLTSGEKVWSEKTETDSTITKHVLAIGSEVTQDQDTIIIKKAQGKINLVFSSPISK